MPTTTLFRHAGAGCALLWFATAAVAASRTVDSLAALQSAINAAAPGDTITLKDGVYTAGALISVRRIGTAEQPITITAETIGGAEIAGTHGFHVTGAAAHIVIAGFKFTHAAGKCTVSAGTSHVRFTRNTFQCGGEGAYLAVSGDDAQIDRNTFRDKKTPGAMLAFSGTGGQIARRAWIHRNHFHDFANASNSGAEALRFGLGAQGLSIGAGIIEHNLFERCNGEQEVIVNKSSGNVYRYNTVADCPAAQFALRGGNDCLVYGNILRNTEGLRIFGDRHRVHGNYLEKNFVGIGIGNGSGEIADGAPAATAYDRPDDCVIAFNTFVENRTHYQMSKRSPAGLGAKNTVFANNLLVGGGVAARIDGPNPGAQWSGNIVWKVGGAGALPAEGYISANPQLAEDASGILRLAAGSPAIDAAKGDHPLVSVDFEGQPRDGAKDVGADEFSPAPVVARLLTPADVGPQSK
ncbi:MAG: polysaccharide lyase 6 family protein [Opitutaceae bacterium]|nr:polysaccharide lyase 6 family protein [Opitutaceae bacterium]